MIEDLVLEAIGEPRFILEVPRIILHLSAGMELGNRFGEYIVVRVVRDGKDEEKAWDEGGDNDWVDGGMVMEGCVRGAVAGEAGSEGMDPITEVAMFGGVDMTGVG